MKKLHVISTLLLALTVSCGDFSTEPDWTKYDSGLKSRIDYSNCEGLQKEFNTAAETLIGKEQEQDRVMYF